MVVMLAALAAAAQAAPPAKEKAAGGAVKKAPPLRSEEKAKLNKDLTVANEAAAVAAAKRLGEAADPTAVPMLIEALSLGTSPTVAAEILAALGMLRDARAVPVLALHAGNRNVPVRHAAVKALGGIPSDEGTAVLLDRLGDQEGQVRSAAAEGLAARKVARAVPRLLKLVARSDAGAAPALGALIPADEVPRLAELTGQIDEGVLTAACAAVLARADMPDPARVEMVRSLARMSGAAATAALTEYAARAPANDARPSRAEAQKALDRRGGK